PLAAVTACASAPDAMAAPANSSATVLSFFMVLLLRGKSRSRAASKLRLRCPSPKASNLLCHTRLHNQRSRHARTVGQNLIPALLLLASDKGLDRRIKGFARPHPSRLHDPIRQGNPAHQPRRGDAAKLPRLRD